MIRVWNDFLKDNYYDTLYQFYGNPSECPICGEPFERDCNSTYMEKRICVGAHVKSYELLKNLPEIRGTYRSHVYLIPMCNICNRKSSSEPLEAKCKGTAVLLDYVNTGRSYTSMPSDASDSSDVSEESSASWNSFNQRNYIKGDWWKTIKY